MLKYFVLPFILGLICYIYYFGFKELDIFTNYSCNTKILTGIVCTDRDVNLAPKLLSGILKNTQEEIIVVTRETDVQTQIFWENKAKIVTIPHYDIEQRHNIQKIAEKRTIIVDYAKTHGYDAVWFVDSDVIPTKGVLDQLKNTQKDICVAPYKVRWIDKICVGVYHSESEQFKIRILSFEDTIVKRRDCVIGGFGCTLIKSSTFDQNIEIGSICIEGFGVEGEDIGFFLNCFNAGLKCEYLTRWEQPHYCDR